MLDIEKVIDKIIHELWAWMKAKIKVIKVKKAREALNQMETTWLKQTHYFEGLEVKLVNYLIQLEE